MRREASCVDRRERERSMEEVCLTYQRGVTLKELSAELGWPISRLWEWTQRIRDLWDEGDHTPTAQQQREREFIESGYRTPDAVCNAIRTGYIAGQTVASLAEKFELSPWTIRAILKRTPSVFDSMRDKGGPGRHSLTPEQEQIRADFIGGMKIIDIARSRGTYPQRIRYILDKPPSVIAERAQREAAEPPPTNE